MKKNKMSKITASQSAILVKITKLITTSESPNNNWISINCKKQYKNNNACL